MVYGTYQRVEPSAWYSQAFGKADVFVEGTFLTRGADWAHQRRALSITTHLRAGDAFARVDYRPDDREVSSFMASHSEHAHRIPIDLALLHRSQTRRRSATQDSSGECVHGNAPPVFRSAQP